MRRLLTTTTALSIALAPVNPWPLMAQTLTETGSIVAEDGTVKAGPALPAKARSVFAISAAVDCSWLEAVTTPVTTSPTVRSN